MNDSGIALIPDLLPVKHPMLLKMKKCSPGYYDL